MFHELAGISCGLFHALQGRAQLGGIFAHTLRLVVKPRRTNLCSKSCSWCRFHRYILSSTGMGLKRLLREFNAM